MAEEVNNKTHDITHTCRLCGEVVEDEDKTCLYESSRVHMDCGTKHLRTQWELRRQKSFS